MPKKRLLNVKVFWLPISKEIFYKGKAEAVSSQNKLGNFDILPHHSNFITLIFKTLTILTPKKTKINYQFERGVLMVRNDEVKIFLGL